MYDSRKQARGAGSSPPYVKQRCALLGGTQVAGTNKDYHPVPEEVCASCGTKFIPSWVRQQECRPCRTRVED